MSHYGFFTITRLYINLQQIHSLDYRRHGRAALAAETVRHRASSRRFSAAAADNDDSWLKSSIGPPPKPAGPRPCQLIDEAVAGRARSELTWMTR